MKMQGLRVLLAAVAVAGLVSGAWAHGDEKHFAAGEPGKAAQNSRTVEIVMKEGDGNMSYTPNRVEVKRGEQIRFVIKNAGELKHEFMLATEKENTEHGKLMEKFPNMEHDDPNGKTLEAGQSTEMLWRFTKVGTYEFACLSPGHHQAGMHGSVVVK